MPKNLNLESLGDLAFGQAGAVINDAIHKALSDIDDRGEDKQPRKVNVCLTFKKLDSGQVQTSCEASTSLPKYRTISTIGDIKHGKHGPELSFSPLAPGNPKQQTIEDEVG